MLTDDRPTRRSLAASFRFAAEGLLHFLRTQRSARLEIAIGIAAVSLGAWLGLGYLEWAVLFLTIALVLSLEGINSALELAVDLASPRLDPRAKAAKDLAAGMVLIAAIASVAVGIALFAPPLLRRLGP